MKTSRKTTTPVFIISRCYSEVTPESAEDGDFSDSGFVYEYQEMTASELEREIRIDCFSAESSCDWLMTGFHLIDYATGTEREETLHFSRDNHPRLRKHFDRIARIASGR